ncbi:MAG: Re/Si-specific NAD(P)(+) transhydrogenase subunit alpha [Pirellulaceae bacterium]|nr:Re/Si-specific NAD(P)(+) transhydrogenase subunit alpha [Pirellulaceae bacterium]
MKIFVPRESFANECRVAATPQSVKKLIKLGFQIQVQTGAGHAASFPDALYEEAGAVILPQAQDGWRSADIVIAVNPPSMEEAQLLKPESVLVGFVWPAKNKELVAQLASQQVSTLAMDCVPRISRAQKLDALSSMANIAGYRAVVEAAMAFGSFFTGQITAAGKVPPAKVMVIGAGVAGLSAIGTARGLGAVVRAFDTRPAVKDQVKSMGAEFLELEFEESGEGAGGYAKEMSPAFIKAEMELFAAQAKEVDMIITTALIPGKPAPKLILADMVRSMKAGSVIVDLAAEQGGNCELTRPGEKYVTDNGVTIIGYSDLPSRLPTQASTLYANNIVNLLTDMTPDKDGVVKIDLKDQVVRGTLVTHRGDVTWPPPSIASPSPAIPAAKEPKPIPAAKKEPGVMSQPMVMGCVLISAAIFLFTAGYFLPAQFVGHLTVLVLACFIGWQVVWNVTPALHTPLMSVTNAISGIIVIGGIMQMGANWYSASSLLAAVAVLIASINIAGGFLVTQRMLGMFRKQG